jgi:hypothetical protein
MREGAEMGNYMVNGEIIDVREDRPTAADLKRHTNSLLMRSTTRS